MYYIKKEMVERGSIIFVIFLFIVYEEVAGLESREYCFSGLPSVIECDASDIISIHNLSIERNCRSKCTAGCTTNKNYSCPVFQSMPADLYYYKKISGGNQASFKTERFSCGAGVPIFTNIVKIQYSCIKNISILDLSNGDIQKTDKTIHLMYRESKIARKEYTCRVSTVGTLQVYAVDIRLQNVNRNLSCAGTSETFLQLDNSKTISCEDNIMLRKYKLLYNSESHLDIIVNITGNPQMIWIAINSSDGKNVSVDCGDEEQTSPLSTSKFSSKVYETLTTEAQNPCSRISTSKFGSKVLETLTTKAQNPIIKTFNSTVKPRLEITNLSITSGHSKLKTTEMTVLDRSTKSINAAGKDTRLSVSDKEHKSRIDPAIIALIIAGILVLLILTTGIVIAVKRINKKRFPGKLQEYVERHDGYDDHSYANVDKSKTDEILPLDDPTPGQSTVSSLDRTLERQMPTILLPQHESSEQKGDGEQHTETSTIGSDYDHINRQDFSSSYTSVNSHQNLEPSSYDHVPIHQDLSHDSQYDHVELSDLDNCKVEPMETTGIPGDAASSDHHDGSQSDCEINPYVDEVVVKGMSTMKRDFYKSSSSINTTMNDLITYANDWASNSF